MRQTQSLIAFTNISVKIFALGVVLADVVHLDGLVVREDDAVDDDGTAEARLAQRAAAAGEHITATQVWAGCS